MQVATSRAAYVFHLPALQANAHQIATDRCIGEALTHLRPLLAAPDVFKCGVGSAGDKQTLQQLDMQLQLWCVSTLHCYVCGIVHLPAVRKRDSRARELDDRAPSVGWALNLVSKM